MKPLAAFILFDPEQFPGFEQFCTEAFARIAPVTYDQSGNKLPAPPEKKRRSRARQAARR